MVSSNYYIRRLWWWFVRNFRPFWMIFWDFYMISVWPLWLSVKLRRPVTRDRRIDLIGTVYEVGLWLILIHTHHMEWYLACKGVGICLKWICISVMNPGMTSEGCDIFGQATYLNLDQNWTYVINLTTIWSIWSTVSFAYVPTGTVRCPICCPLPSLDIFLHGFSWTLI